MPYQEYMSDWASYRPPNKHYGLAVNIAFSFREQATVSLSPGSHPLGMLRVSQYLLKYARFR